MHNFILTTPEQLTEIVIQAVRNELSTYRPVDNSTEEESEEFMTFNQTLLLLKISRPTLFKRMDDNTIPYQRVGRRLLFPKKKIIRELEKRANATKKPN